MFLLIRSFLQNQSYKNPLVVKRKIVMIIIGLFRLAFIVGLCYLFLFPVFYMVSVALQDPSNANDPSVIWLPKKYSMVAILGAIDVLKYWQSTLLTIWVSVGSTIAALLSCSLIGYGFARFKFPGRNIVFFFVFLTIIIPPQTFLMSSYLNFRFFDIGGLLKLLAPLTGVKCIYLLDTPWTFILPSMFGCGLRSGLFIFIFRQFFSGLPKDLEEAAKIDGCGTFKTFVRIMIPLAVPAFVSVLLFSFIWHWNDYYSSSMYFASDIKPLSVMLSSIQMSLQGGSLALKEVTAYEIRMYVQAGALLTVLPPLIIYIFTQKYFTESIERTGIVG